MYFIDGEILVLLRRNMADGQDVVIAILLIFGICVLGHILRTSDVICVIYMTLRLKINGLHTRGPERHTVSLKCSVNCILVVKRWKKHCK